MIELRVMQLNSGDTWVERTYQDMNELRDDLTQTASNEYQSEVLNNLPTNEIVVLPNGPNYVDTYEIMDK